MKKDKSLTIKDVEKITERVIKKQNIDFIKGIISTITILSIIVGMPLIEYFTEAELTVVDGTMGTIGFVLFALFINIHLWGNN